MCGINGIIKLNNQTPQREDVAKMMRKQKHRGPDDEGVFIHKNVGLGFVRLSILDLTSQGHQPMIDDTENYVIVFNGEIYNYLELRSQLIEKGINFKSNSDTEVLLNLYKLYGTKPVIINELYGSPTLDTALLNHFEYKLEHLLKWSDRNSMAFSLESRTPFLDYRLVEYTLSLPADKKIEKGETKHVLREAMKGILPEAIRKRNDKVGFETPQDSWFRTEEFQRFINNILNAKSFEDRRIIDVDKAKQLYQSHLAKKINISKDIWKWIHLELWYREFIDEK